MNDENIRCKKFLSGSSFEKVVREYQMRLVQDHLQFLHKECRMMVQKELREGTEDGVMVSHLSATYSQLLALFVISWLSYQQIYFLKLSSASVVLDICTSFII